MPPPQRQEAFSVVLAPGPVERCLAGEADSVGTVEFWSVGVLSFGIHGPLRRGLLSD
jgi:hypothetical protein